MRPPWIWRAVLIPIRHWVERDERMLVVQWKAAYRQERKKVVPINLLVVRSDRQRVRRRSV